ncbi:NB-ARC domain-containing protein [Limnofasciculus baicalensis]|uniref:NB-ARC domain-containing protein n=1 Tax=Limnofasciculus baicalensis BBK-W-15 TaxID=2699891 RepID=A0AAE3GPY4_9CYAN|nr:NB-ARC domain-containing protein [Limnofasciculus baicalensis]MCP2728525.1 NB-ARC domain-containing protein [Limnofasciculus baicalensis BBK-W-15]
MALKASAQGLEIVDKARKKKGWTKTVTVAWWQDALTTQATLRRFWRGIPIQSESFINICQVVGISNWEDILDCSTDEELEVSDISAQEDWGEAPEMAAFYGRTEELNHLHEWIINDKCRLVSLLGMGGIGKTALSVMLADKIQNEFDYVIWRSLRYCSSVPDLLTQLIKFFSNKQVTELSNNSGNAVSQLLDYMKSHRCLVILDGAEAILNSGEMSESYKEGYESFGELIKRVGKERHQSCILLTSREQLNEIALIEEETPQVRSLLLSDINNAAAWQLFQSKGLSDENCWQHLLKIYRGNPLVLNIISSYIKKYFVGKVGDFLKLETIFIGDIQLILDTSWQRLSSLQKELMFQLATEPSSLVKLKLNSSVSTSDIMAALQSLERRSLIQRQLEGNDIIYTLQPIVKKYVKKRAN